MTAMKITPAMASLLSSCLQVGVEEAPDEVIEAAGGEEQLEKVHELIGELRSWASGGIDGVLLIEGARYHAYCQDAKAAAHMPAYSPSEMAANARSIHATPVDPETT